MRNTSIILALVIVLVACGGAARESASTTAVETPTTTDPATEPPPPAAEESAAECPLFCVRRDAACMRPDYAEPPGSCGAFQAGRLPEPTIACPDVCCRAAVSEGDDPDADGVAGADDLCPDAPEDLDGFQDQDGCSDPDNDGDAIDDPQDMCCYVAEDMDEDRDLDGCPE
jgi:hypothetical protein